MKPSRFKIGDRVQYNHAFLKSIQADKEIADLKGTVKDVVYRNISKVYFIRVLWDGENDLRTSGEKTLCKIGLDITV